MRYKSRYLRKSKWHPVAWLFAAIIMVMIPCTMYVVGKPMESVHPNTMDAAIMDKYDMAMTNRISDALSGIVSVDKVYWLSDEDMIAPKPDPARFGETDDPSTLQWLLDDAAELLDGQPTLFTTETQIVEGSKVKYYLDDTIFAVTWKQGVGLSVFTCSEVKIAHPSQFRRFLAGGEYGNRIRYTTTEMAQSVNAVTASSGDYYAYRKFGVVVNNGVVYRADDRKLDACYVDDKGDLIFVPRDTIYTKEDVQKFVDENNIRFGLAFGPILIEDGEIMVPEEYIIGELDKNHSRAALCQLGECHYMLVAANIQLNYYRPPKLINFAKQLREMGVMKAYTLDGGQTATIVTGGERINHVDYGGERDISDILYFATAIPDEP